MIDHPLLTASTPLPWFQVHHSPPAECISAWTHQPKFYIANRYSSQLLTERAQDRFAVVLPGGRVSQVCRDVLLEVHDSLVGHTVEGGHVKAQEHL